MAEGWQKLDAGFPSFGRDTPLKQWVEKLHNYLFQMKQSLQITLQSMDKENRLLKERVADLEKKLEILENPPQGNDQNEGGAV